MRWTRPVAIVTGLALVLLTAVVHGRWTGRWALSHELQQAVARIGSIPDRFGDWEGRPAVELGEQQLAIAEIDGYLARRYRNLRDGGEVTVLLVCGRPGPISLHTPDVCYRGLGYVPAEEPVDRPVSIGPGGREAGTRAAVFRKQDAPVPDALAIYWSWNGEGDWEAPKDPRLRFASGQALYKLYVIRAVASADEQLESLACEEFLREFVPELDRSLFPESAG